MSNVRISQLVTPIGVVEVVLVVPLPAAVLGVLIALNISGSVLAVLTTMSIERPMDMFAFPSLVLGPEAANPSVVEELVPPC